ncbi:NAD(P)/FAD-dependent oxidoreductase [uncultured Algimonas sp.]|uniref:flavin-containing monooxygenase n=1 Tax=uncultured Algimonas sp. TaxID=1547920 RepID=UPI00260CC98F|nr:NAD(P)/FAD-dependent oxidoreductase [uncultured Algimonas sp.]
MTAPLDLVIIGAGLSGIGAACRYVTAFPDGRFTILEARDAIGGTWDLFRYPGIRSDSDMLTLGYDFRPWPGAKTLADGPAIRDYVRDTAAEYGVDERVEFDSRVVGLDFSTGDDLWTVAVETDGRRRKVRARFVLSCAGYYRYDKGHDPAFEGREDFAGDIIHPQFWPEELDHSGKRIAVIGSGATAVTLVPELAKTAAHVVQVQRTPSYVASIPSEDPVVKLTSKILPSDWSYRLNRWKNVKLTGWFYRRAQADPQKARANLRKRTLKAVGADYPVDVHFNPPYNPWDQRLCMVPDGDMFAALKARRASIATGRIERFTTDGILMQDGTSVEADLIVTATGLELNFGTNYPIAIDGAPRDPSEGFTYKGVMVSGLPNMMAVFGYTNASWTLRADLMTRYMIRLMRHLQKTGMTRVVPVAPEGMERRPILDFQAGYLQRAIHTMPAQGDRMPWLNVQDYRHDCQVLIEDPLADEALRFSRVEAKAALPEPAE